mmetsp:Transcript_18977/g.57659  ORF Transcript_18977/g.57659 Transcript_18977/m.57659 type:complete len:235 (-) Transcript_18977:560-1264(-)
MEGVYIPRAKSTSPVPVRNRGFFLAPPPPPKRGGTPSPQRLRPPTPKIGNNYDQNDSSETGSAAGSEDSQRPKRSDPIPIKSCSSRAVASRSGIHKLIFQRLEDRAASARRANRGSMRRTRSTTGSSSSMSSMGVGCDSASDASGSTPGSSQGEAPADSGLGYENDNDGCVLFGCANCGDPFLSSGEFMNDFCSGECMISHSLRNSQRGRTRRDVVREPDYSSVGGVTRGDLRA